jgi:drug/metabolite transporter (DMT)-like permease
MSGVFVKFITVDSGLSALRLAFWRDLFTFLVLLIGTFAIRPSWLRVARRHLAWLLATGAAIGTFHVLWNLGVNLNGAAVATVQQAAMPAIVAVMAWIIWREPLTWQKGVAITLTIAGTVMVSDLEALRQAELSLATLLIGLGIPLCYAGWNLFSKKVRQWYNPVTTLTYTFASATIVLFPLQLLTRHEWLVPIATGHWFAGLVIVATIIPFILYTFALGRIQTSVASILAMTEIPVVSLYAYMLLDERLTHSQILGALLVVAGTLFLFQRGDRTREREPETNTVADLSRHEG